LITRRVARIERLFLTPLVFIFPAAALLYLLRGAWFIALFLILMSFGVGAIGQSLHKDKTYDQLKSGGLTDEENVLPPQKQISDEEARVLARSILFSSFVCSIVTGVLLSHHGSSGWICVGIALAVVLLLPILLGLLVMRP
jgi:hypothetical protein